MNSRNAKNDEVMKINGMLWKKPYTPRRKCPGYKALWFSKIETIQVGMLRVWETTTTK